MKTWWVIGRLVGHVEPIVCVPAKEHGEAVLFAAANYELRPEEIVIRQVPPSDLQPERRKYRKPRPGNPDWREPNDDDE